MPALDTFRRHGTTLALLLLLALVHWGLWLGDGGRRHVAQLRAQLQTQQAQIAAARRVNAQLAAEVDDFRRGLEMVEERARALGMVKPDEVFVQLRAATKAIGASPAAAGTGRVSAPPSAAR